MADLDPSTLEPAAFDAWFNAQAQDGQPTSQALQGVPQETLATLATTSQQLEPGMDPNFLTEANRRMGLREGVPFNLEQGAPAGVRAQLSFDTDTVNQFKLLSKFYGIENVTSSGDGRFVIQNQTNPATGLKEDFHVDPIGADRGDVAGMTADILPILAGAVGARFGGRMGGRPATRFLGGLAGGAAGAEGTAAIETGLKRLFAGNDIKPGSIAYERSKAALADMTIGAGMAGGTKVLSKAAQGLLGGFDIPTGSTATTRAASELAKETGVKYPLSPGEAAESPLLMRMEATAKPRIGSVGVMGQLEQGKAQAEDELRRIFHGLPRTMSDEDLAAALPKRDVTGQQVLSELRIEAEQLEGGVLKAKTGVERAATREAQAVAGVNLAAPLESTAVGQALRTKTNTDMATFKSTMGQRYDAFEALPEIRDRVVAGDKLADVGDAVESRLFPQAKRTKPTGIAGPTGAPLTTTVTEPIDAFVATAARRAVDGLKSLRGAQVSIADMKRIRTSIDNSIAEGVAIPGTDIKQLTSIREQVTDAIRDSLGKMNPALLKQWDDLGADYAKGIARFDKLGIRRMLIKEGEPGSIGNAQLAHSVASGTEGALDRYNEFKSFFGATSPEFQAIQQKARESVLEGALEETSGYVKGSALRSRLRALDPEVATDLFGTSKQELHKIGQALEGVQGNLDLAELRTLSRNGTLTAAAIPALEAAELKRALAFGNKLLASAARGLPDAEVIKPSDVIRSLTAMDPDDAYKVLGVLSSRPALLEDARRLAVEEIWGRVQGQLKGRRGVTSGLIEAALGNETQRRTWKSLLGGDVVANLERLSAITRPQALSTTAFGSAGNLSTAADITALERGGIFNVAAEAAQRMLIATLYTGPARQAIINLATPLNQGRLLNTIIASAPFVERVAERFGDDAPSVMQALRDVVEPKQARQLQLEGRVQGDALDPATMTPEEFDLWMKQAVQ